MIVVIKFHEIIIDFHHILINCHKILIDFHQILKKNVLPLLACGEVPQVVRVFLTDNCAPQSYQNDDNDD